MMHVTEDYGLGTNKLTRIDSAALGNLHEVQPQMGSLEKMQNYFISIGRVI